MVCLCLEWMLHTACYYVICSQGQSSQAGSPAAAQALTLKEHTTSAEQNLIPPQPMCSTVKLCTAESGAFSSVFNLV